MSSRTAAEAFRPVALPDGYHGWIPAVGTYPGCGALTPYMYGAALAHSQVFDFILHKGNSGGAIVAAMLAARAPIEKVEAICDAWDPRDALHQAKTQGWRRYVDIQGRGNAERLREFLDAQFISLGHRTWGSFRYDERPPGIDLDHRLQIGLCYVDIPEKHVASYMKDRPTFLRTLIAARSVAIKSMVFPRDVDLLLPHLAGKVDELPVADWLVHTSRHVSQFPGEPMPGHGGGLRVLIDGATRCPQPYLFPGNQRPPYPEVTFRYDVAKDRTRQVARDLHDFPWTLINRAVAPCESFDIETITRIKSELIQRGYADCAADMQSTVLPYLTCMATEGAFRPPPERAARQFHVPARPVLTAARQRVIAVGASAQARAGDIGHAVGSAPSKVSGGLLALRAKMIQNAPAEPTVLGPDQAFDPGMGERAAGLGY